jgi:C1A family cysteine protease
MTLKIIIILVILSILFQLYFSSEPFKKKNNKLGDKKTRNLNSEVIGQGKTVQVAFVRPIIPNLIVPLRDQVQTWVVKVPLTPFRAPFVELPPLKSGESLPNFLLWKPELLSPIRNQGACGSCWAFATCDAISDRMMIKYGGLFRKNLSVQQLLSCFEPEGCDGGSPEEACFWLQDTQTPLYTESSFKYKSSSGGYVNIKCPKKFVGNAVRVKSTVSIVEYIEEEGYDKKVLRKNIENMKRALYETGPFYCAMSVYDDLFEYTGLEIYRKHKHASLIGGHAIEIIGYCDKGVDKRYGFKDSGYWICRNSWGLDWPTQTQLDGFFMVEMGSNMCGIESRCGFADGDVIGLFNPDEQEMTLNEMRYTNYDDYINS